MNKIILTTFKCVTYNCNSIRNKIEIIKSLTANFDIVILQEILLLQSDLGYLDNISNEHFSYSCVKDNIIDGINVGRP